MNIIKGQFENNSIEKLRSIEFVFNHEYGENFINKVAIKKLLDPTNAIEIINDHVNELMTVNELTEDLYSDGYKDLLVTVLIDCFKSTFVPVYTYLEYVNNFITLVGFCEYMKLDEEEAVRLINIGRGILNKN